MPIIIPSSGKPGSDRRQNKVIEKKRKIYKPFIPMDYMEKEKANQDAQSLIDSVEVEYTPQEQVDKDISIVCRGMK